MTVERRDSALVGDLAFPGVVKALRMFGRFGDLAHDLANGRAGLELRHPARAARVHGALEHVAIELVHHAARVGRARLLSKGDGRSESQKSEKGESAQHS